MVGPGEPTSDPAITQPPAGVPNRIVLVETPKSRTLEAHLTNPAVARLSDAFAAFTGERLLARQGSRRPLNRDVSSVVEPEQNALPKPAVEGEVRESVTSAARAVGVSVGGHGGIERLMSELDRTAHSQVFDAPRVLDRGLHLLKIAQQQFGLDGMTAMDIAGVLKEKFRLPTTP